MKNMAFLDSDMIEDRGKIFPNLALMKLAGYWKRQGYDVLLNKVTDDTEKVFISNVFSHNVNKALELRDRFISQGFKVEVGGYFIDPSSYLGDEIEYSMPYYDLYPDIDFSLGFTSRGCIRNCKFCVVPKKEGKIAAASDISEFWDKRHKKIVLLDNNLLASPTAEQVLRDIIAADLEVEFNQGLDMRLVDHENAALLARCKFESIRFSLDNVKMKDIFIRSVNILKDKGVKLYKIQVCVLIGFNTSWEEDKIRFQICKDFGLNVFPMLYRDDNFEYRKTLDVPKDIYEQITLLDTVRMPIGESQKIKRFYLEGVKKNTDTKGWDDIFD